MPGRRPSPPLFGCSALVPSPFGPGWPGCPGWPDWPPRFPPPCGFVEAPSPGRLLPPGFWVVPPPGVGVVALPPPVAGAASPPLSALYSGFGPSLLIGACVITPESLAQPDKMTAVAITDQTKGFTILYYALEGDKCAGNGVRKSCSIRISDPGSTHSKNMRAALGPHMGMRTHPWLAG